MGTFDWLSNTWVLVQLCKVWTLPLSHFLGAIESKILYTKNKKKNHQLLHLKQQLLKRGIMQFLDKKFKRFKSFEVICEAIIQTQTCLMFPELNEQAVLRQRIRSPGESGRVCQIFFVKRLVKQYETELSFKVGLLNWFVQTSISCWLSLGVNFLQPFWLWWTKEIHFVNQALFKGALCGFGEEIRAQNFNISNINEVIMKTLKYVSLP